MPQGKKRSNFVHLHNHSEFSLLDGASRIEEMVKLAVEYKMPALALTDHGNMFGAIKFYQEARSAGLKPIIGAEVYVAPGNRREKEIREDIPEASFHLTLLCENEKGYYNLMRLISLGYLEGFYYKPRVDKELLKELSKGLIALSGCLKGEVNFYLLRGDFERALEAAASYQEIFGPNNFYLEVMRTGIPEQERVIPKTVEISHTLDIPIVATNDNHYLRPEDAQVQDVVVCIQTGKRLKDSDRMRLSGSGFYFRSEIEMQEVFKDLPEAVLRTQEIAERCNLVLDLERKSFHLPAFSPPKEFSDEFAYLTHLAREGLRRRYQEITPKVEERLNYELKTIERMGFAGYFLIVRDIIEFARNKNIPVGPGRGSAAGSLVLYCLGITDIDPLRYGLLFERFLSPERVTLPDVDIDFADTRRQEVIEYIRQRYGENSVAQIITFGTMQARAAIRDVGRVLDIPISEVDRIAKMIPPGMELSRVSQDAPELMFLLRAKPEYQKLYEIATRLEGLCRHASVHASAVVITPKPLLEFVPLYKVPGGDTCTQYDMYSLEAIGLLKIDVLGLRTLTVIDEAIKLIRHSGKKIDLATLNFNDQRTYELLQRGETVGVFQLESSGMRDVCTRTKPERLEHIIALIALYRPGPMDLIPNYVARKNGSEPIEYEHKLLEPFCQETYGIMIYQEQVMQAAQVLAGYTLGQADILRRAMGKKLPQEMAAQRERFVTGCMRHAGISREKAEKIFETLAKFAGYGFNKSHAAGYAYLSYITAYLKANHPVEFIAAAMTSELNDSDKLAKFVQEARRMGINILGPDINHSEVGFAIENEQVRFGLAGIKNIGEGAAAVIVDVRKAEGPYQSLLDFLIRHCGKGAKCRGKINRKAVESLIKAGAFDSFKTSLAESIAAYRYRLLKELDSEIAKAVSERLLFQEKQTSLFEEVKLSRETRVNFASEDDSNRDAEWGIVLTFEKESLGFYLTSHPLERYRAEYEALGLVPTSLLEGFSEDTPVAIGGVITKRRTKKDRRGREYFIITLEDFESSVEVMVFADLLSECRSLLEPEKLIIIQGRVKPRVGRMDQILGNEERGGGGILQIWAERVYDFAIAKNFIKSLILEVQEENLDDKTLLKLKDVLKRFPGQVPVILNVVGTTGWKRKVLLKDYCVQIEPGLVAELKGVLGDDKVKLTGALPPYTRQSTADSRRAYL
ncbi:MAG: DNA polymerase III subunit alpha [candidate division WOR-3 bacterium]